MPMGLSSPTVEPNAEVDQEVPLQSAPPPTHTYVSHVYVQNNKPVTRRGDSRLSQSQQRLFSSRKGNPGKKHQQRMSNKLFLLEQMDKVCGQDRIDDEFNFFEWYDTPFAKLFTEKRCQLVWEPFIDITEERQEYLLKELAKKKGKGKKGKIVEPLFSDEEDDWFVVPSKEDDRNDWYLVPQDENNNNTSKHKLENNKIKDKKACQRAFNERVSKKIRRIIMTKKNSESDFLANIDKDIINYIERGAGQDPLTYTFNDSFRRLMCHGVAQFYSLRSFSKDGKEGDRIVIIRKPKEVTIPPQTFSSFLEL